VALADARLDPEIPAVLDFRRGEYATDRGSGPAVQPGAASAVPAPGPADSDQTGQYRLVYMPAASHCYAIVQYDVASARLVRRVVGLFGDVACAEDYAHRGGYTLYDVVPATAVIPKTL
jgi:hypothetical protein